MINLLPRGLLVGGVAAIILAVSGYLLYQHYLGVLDKVGELQRENATLQVSIDLQKETIKEQQSAIREWSEAMDRFTARVEELARVTQDAASESRKLDETLSDSDLGKLAREKPGLIERRINRGTARIGRLLECATGAPHPDCPDIGGPAASATDSP